MSFQSIQFFGFNKVSGAVALDPDAEAFLTATAITDATISTAINNLVVGLKADSLWTKMKVIYPFVGGTADTHKYNLMDPRDLDAAYRIVWGGTVSHSSNGIQGDGSTGYGNTKFVPASVLDRNSTSLSWYLRSNDSPQNTIFGSMAPQFTDPRLAIHVRWSDGNYYGDIFDATTTRLSFNNSSPQGFYTQTRLNTSAKVFLNNTLKASKTVSLNPTISSILTEFYLLAANYGENLGQNPFISNYSTSNFGIFIISDGLTDTDISNLYTLNLNFQTELGRNV